MGHVEESWNDVGEQFKKLGARLGRHYDEQGFKDAVGASEESLEEAMQRLGEGLRAAVGAVGDSVSDPELKDDIRDATGSLFTALGTTFSELGAQIAAPHEETPIDDEAPVEGGADTEGDPPVDPGAADAADGAGNAP
jgi:hypothetical protein